MKYKDQIPRMRAFVREKPIFREALAHLDKGSSVGVHFEGQLFFLQIRENQSELGSEALSEPLISFTLSPLAAESLLSTEGLEIAEFSLVSLKLMTRSEIKLKLQGSVMKLIMGGYLELLRATAPELIQWVYNSGFSNLVRARADLWSKFRHDDSRVAEKVSSPD